MENSGAVEINHEYQNWKKTHEALEHAQFTKLRNALRIIWDKEIAEEMAKILIESKARGMLEFPLPEEAHYYLKGSLGDSKQWSQLLKWVLEKKEKGYFDDEKTGKVLLQLLFMFHAALQFER